MNGTDEFGGVAVEPSQPQRDEFGGIAVQAAPAAPERDEFGGIAVDTINAHLTNARAALSAMGLLEMGQAAGQARTEMDSRARGSEALAARSSFAGPGEYYSGDADVDRTAANVVSDAIFNPMLKGAGEVLGKLVAAPTDMAARFTSGFVPASVTRALQAPGRIARTTGEFVGEQTSPFNAALIAAIPGLPQLAQKAVSAYFATTMGADLIENAQKAVEKGSVTLEEGTRMVLEGAMAALAGHHAASPLKAPIRGQVPAAKAAGAVKPSAGDEGPPPLPETGTSPSTVAWPRVQIPTAEFPAPRIPAGFEAYRRARTTPPVTPLAPMPAESLQYWRELGVNIGDKVRVPGDEAKGLSPLNYTIHNVDLQHERVWMKDDETGALQPAQFGWLNRQQKAGNIRSGRTAIPLEGGTPPAPPERLPTTPTPVGSARPTETTEAAPPEIPTTTAIHPEVVGTVELPVDKLKLSKDVPNFKGGASETTGTVAGQELSGKYERRGTAPIVVWERLNGDHEVITGRHRLDLARRTGEKTIPAQVVREADGFTKDMALTFDAEANIRDGQGEVADYATYFKGTNISQVEAQSRGLLSRVKGKAGWSLAKAATDDVYALWRDGKITDQQAVAIANAAPGDASAQQIGSKFALQGKSADFVSNVIKASRVEAGTRGENLDLFGADDSAMRTMAEQAERASQFLRRYEEATGYLYGEPRAATAPAGAAGAGPSAPPSVGDAARGGNFGGAHVSEFERGPVNPTAMKYHLIDQERQQRGLEPLTKPQGLSDRQAMDKAMDAVDKNPEYGDQLVKDILANPRAIEDWQNHVLLLRKIDLRRAFDQAVAEGDQARADGRLLDIDDAKKQADEASDKLTELETASRMSGSKRGSALRSLQVMANEDFSLAALEQRKRAANNFRPLTDAERTQLAEVSTRNRELEKQLADAVSKSEMEAIIDRVRTEVTGSQPRFHPDVLTYAERMVSSLESSADAAWQRIQKKMGSTNVAVDPTILSDLAIMGAAKLARGALDFGKWTADMAVKVGPWFNEHAQKVWEASQKLHEAQWKKVPEGIRDAVKRVAKGATPAEKVAASKEKIGGKFASGKGAEIHTEVRKLVRAIVEENPKIEREELVDTVHAILRDNDPAITRLEAMDAISGRGRFWHPNQDEVSKTVRDLGTQIRLVGHQQDVVAGKPLPRTGYQPDKMSETARREQQILNDLKRQHGVVVTNPAAQLESTLQARKTYYTHRLEDLRAEISAGEKIRKNKTAQPGDAELDALKAEYQKVKAEHDVMFPPEPRVMTPEQKAKMALASAERIEADWNKKLADAKRGVFEGQKPGQRITNPQIEAVRARADAAKAETQHLRDINVALQESRRMADLNKAIADREARIQQNRLAPDPTKPKIETPATKAAQARLDALNDQLRALREQSGMYDAKRHAAALKAIDAAIAEAQHQITSGKLPPQLPGRPVPPELAAKRAELAELNAIRAKMRAAEKPKKSPEEVALSSLKSRMLTQLADLQYRQWQMDYAPKPRQSVAMDTAALRIKTELETVRRDFAHSLALDRAKNRPLGQKVWEGVKETLNLPRAILSSWDVSAVLRQGGFIALGHPLLAAKSIVPMFRALASRKQAMMVEQEILSRPNASRYQSSKLYLASLDEFRLSRQEEIMMSRFANAIPGVRHSNLAFMTFLNKLRADTFDTLTASMERGGRGLTQPELNAIANYINIATGRGKMGKAAGAAETLATAFFAPRLVASRFQLLAGEPMYRGSARTRAQVATEYARFLTGIATVLGLGAIMGAQIEKDPRSSDFGKLKFGNTRVDLLAGLAQNTVLISRLASGSMKIGKGKIVPVRGKVPYGGQSAADLIARFARTKLAPTVGTTIDLLSGKNVVGQPVTATSAGLNMITPLSLKDIYDVMREQGVSMGAAVGVLSLFGASVQNYGGQSPSTPSSGLRPNSGLRPEPPRGSSDFGQPIGERWPTARSN